MVTEVKFLNSNPEKVNRYKSLMIKYSSTSSPKTNIEADESFL